MRYISASEIGQFMFCHRQWHLRKKEGPRVEKLAPSDPREIGIRAHQRHAERVEEAQRATDRLGIVIMIAAMALAGIIIGLVIGRLW